MSNSRTQDKSAEPIGPYIVVVVGACLLLVALINFIIVGPRENTPEWIYSVTLAGVIICVVGCVWFYDNLPLPNEAIRAPQPLQLIQDERWRGNTGLRYLETLKEELLVHENKLLKEYAVATKAYEALPHSSGRLKYHWLRRHKTASEGAMTRLKPQIGGLKERIELIVGGNVDAEVSTIRESIRKFERNKQEEQRVFEAWEKPCTIKHDNKLQEDFCEHKRWKAREAIRRKIHEIDFRIIELQNQEQELKSYDFKNLWKQLGHMPVAASGLMAVEKEQLKDMKDKAEILQSMPLLRPVAPKVSPEEERAKRQDLLNARLKRHEQNKRDALEGILQGRKFEDLPEDEQYEFKREQNAWAEILQQDREELRRSQR
jgi:hypothetical protein